MAVGRETGTRDEGRRSSGRAQISSFSLASSQALLAAGTLPYMHDVETAEKNEAWARFMAATDRPELPMPSGGTDPAASDGHDAVAHGASCWGN
jgi:hypothetical protein